MIKSNQSRPTNLEKERMATPLLKPSKSLLNVPCYNEEQMYTLKDRIQSIPVSAPTQTESGIPHNIYTNLFYFYCYYLDYIGYFSQLIR